MKELDQNSKTWQNLEAAFAGESQACVKYQYYASRAKKDGYEKIAEVFTETSGNEKEHAKMWFKYLHGGQVPDTRDNLSDAAGGENYEHSTMYADFAKIAREEGYDEIAAKFEGVGAIEAEHEARYLEWKERIDDGLVFKSEKITIWKCRNCGHLHAGEEAPEICPVCAHPRAYFERFVAEKSLR